MLETFFMTFDSIQIQNFEALLSVVVEQNLCWDSYAILDNANEECRIRYQRDKSYGSL